MAIYNVFPFGINIGTEEKPDIVPPNMPNVRKSEILHCIKTNKVKKGDWLIIPNTWSEWIAELGIIKNFARINIQFVDPKRCEWDPKKHRFVPFFDGSLTWERKEFPNWHAFCDFSLRDYHDLEDKAVRQNITKSGPLEKPQIYNRKYHALKATINYDQVFKALEPKGFTYRWAFTFNIPRRHNLNEYPINHIDEQSLSYFNHPEGS